MNETVLAIHRPKAPREDPSALRPQDDPSLHKKTSRRVSKLEYFFSKKVGEAIGAYKMIEDNDKILVAVSGGKDSMSLLKVLRYKQSIFPINFDIIACYVDMGLDDERRAALEKYFVSNNYSYTIEETKIWDSRKKKDGGRQTVFGAPLTGEKNYSRRLISWDAAK